MFSVYSLSLIVWVITTDVFKLYVYRPVTRGHRIVGITLWRRFAHISVYTDARRQSSGRLRLASGLCNNNCIFNKILLLLYTPVVERIMKKYISHFIVYEYLGGQARGTAVITI